MQTRFYSIFSDGTIYSGFYREFDFGAEVTNFESFLEEPPSVMKIIKLVSIIILATGISCGAYAWWAWNDLNTAQVHNQSAKIVSIPRGSNTDEALNRLALAGVLKRPLSLKLYIKVKGLSPLIKAGDYRFPSPISPLQVLKQLEEGGEGLGKLTVIEGWNRFDIADAMVKIPSLKLKSKDEALALTDGASLIKDIDPKATNLEGYLFPDTYFVESDTTPKELINRMVKRFRQVWQDQVATPATAAGKSAHEIVTMASIIETEAKLKNERPLVASVIVNRMKKDMTLSMDCTIVYASKMIGKWKNNGILYQSDLDLPSPYNSRKFKGLPPGPVSCPGLPSLLAAVKPADTNYIYYVRDPNQNNGAQNFYSDPAEFEKGVQALRDWEEKQRKAGLR